MTRLFPLFLVLAVLTVSTPAAAGDDVVDYDAGSVGKVVKVPSKDADVTVFTYPPKEGTIADLAENEAALGDYLDALVAKQAFNTAAYVAHYTPEKHDAFIMDWITQNIDALTPPFYFVMSGKLDGSDTKAAFQWYLRGFLASRVDATLCRDTSARQGVRYLNNLLGPELPKKVKTYAAADDLQEQQQEALDYVRAHFSKASPMWLCSHGITSFTDEESGYDPVSKRPEVLDDMAADFLEK